MKPTDFAKALAVAITIFAINVVLAIVVVLFYRFFINPGQTDEFYSAAALRIIPPYVHIGEKVLFLVAGFVFARRCRRRNGVAFAVTCSVMFALLDAASVKFAGTANAAFILSMLGNVVAAVIGAVAGRKRKEQHT